MKKAKACFADGGQISKADQMIAEMNAKYGVSGNSPAPAPVAQQPAPKPQPSPATPQSNGLIGGALNLLGNRQKQIDKASGYANGGLIKGIGTPTSDSIDAQVEDTGEPIKVSTKERIVSHEQDKLLQRLAKAMGFDSVDAFFEAGTGKPVGPTIKAGKRAAAGGLRLDNEPDEYAKAIQQQVLGRDAQGNGSSWSVGAGQKPTIGTMPVTSDRVSGSLPVANAQKESNPLTDGVKPWYAGSSTADNRTGLEMERSRRSEAASAGVLNDPVKSALQYGVVGQNGSASAPTPVANPLVSGVQQNYGNEGRSVSSPITKLNPGAVVDNQFTQGGRNYTVNPTSQEGITRVTATGASPLFTNIDPQKAVTGLKDQMIGGDAASVKEGLARYENANKIRGSMIDSMIAANGGNGIAILPEQQQGNPMMDKLNSLVDEAKKSGRGGQKILDSYAGIVRQQMGNDASRYGADVNAQRAAGHDQVLMRGQDLNAQNELVRLAGNPLDNQAKQLSLTQARRISDLQEKALAGDKTALASLQALTGKNPNADRYITVQGGEEIGPDGMSKIRRPSYVFDQQTGRRVQEDGQQSGAPSVGEVRGGYRFKGGNPADKAAWEKA